MEFTTHNFVGEARGTVVFVTWDVSVVVGKAMVRWDLTCGLSYETKEGSW